MAGQPDLIYRFLALSSHHAAWHTRGGAGYGLEVLLSGPARRAVAPYLTLLLPKLFRFTHDPHPRVKEAMVRLWSVLVKDPVRSINAAIQPILTELLACCGSSSWRERSAGLTGLSVVLPGRGYAEVGPHLGGLWVAVLRCVDDVKETVREDATVTLKVLGRLSLRLCDPGAGGRADEGAAAIATVLPFLLYQGIASPSKEVAGPCMTYLVSLARVGGRLLRPHLAPLVAAGLQGLSAVEDERLSYLQTHADAGTGMFGPGLSGGALEAARLSATSAGPLGSVLDVALRQIGEMSAAELELPGAAPWGEDGEMDEGVAAGPPASLLSALTDVLRSSIRSGIGLPTRGGTARFLTALVSSVGVALRPYAPSLLRALSTALEDPSPALRREWAVATGAVARWAGSADLQRLLSRCGELGRNPAPPLREAGGWALASIARRAPDQLAEWARDAVPLAFTGAQDVDPDVKAAWGEAWETLAPSPAAALRLWCGEVVACIETLLGSPSWHTKQQGATSLSVMVSVLRGTRNTRAGAAIPDALWVAPPLDCPSPVLAPGRVDSPAPALRAWMQCPDAVSPPPVPELGSHGVRLSQLLRGALSGPLWPGKEALLSALASLHGAVGGVIQSGEEGPATVSTLLAQCSRAAPPPVFARGGGGDRRCTGALPCPHLLRCHRGCAGAPPRPYAAGAAAHSGRCSRRGSARAPRRPPPLCQCHGRAGQHGWRSRRSRGGCRGGR